MDSKKNTKRARKIAKSSIEKIATLIISAFGLVAALAWNNAIEKAFSMIFGSQSDVIAMLLYAVVVTIIAVVVTLYLSRLISN